jgi:hypothetical protein
MVIISILTSAVHEESLQPQCCCWWFCVNSRCCQNTRFTVETAAAIQQSQYNTRKTSEQRKRYSYCQHVRLPNVPFRNPVNPTSVDVRQTRVTSPAEEDSIHFLWYATLFRLVSGFTTFRKTVLTSSSKASSQSHSKRRRHIPTTSNLAPLNSVVILDSFAFHDPYKHLCNYTGRKATPIIAST